MAQRDSAVTHAGSGVPIPAGPPHREAGRGRVRADPIAAALLLVAGAIGIWQLLLPWRSTSLAGGPVDPDGTGTVSTTGWQVYRLLRAVPDPDGDIRAAMFSVLGVAVGGGALIVLGLMMMLPLNHRPLGLAGLLISAASILGACWMLVRARAIFDVGLFGLFAQAQLGWYLFLAAGLVGLAGSWKAISTG